MKINIQPRESIEDSIVNGSGVLSEVITSDEQRLFKLEEPDIIRAITALNGRKPNDVFVRSPTPWGDLYSSYRWRQVHKNTEIFSAKFLQFSSAPEIVSETELVNNSKVAGEFNVNLLTEVLNTVSSGWKVEDGISVGQKVTYGVDWLKGETSFEYTHGWGENGEVSESVTLTTGAGVTVLLAPGQAVVAQMIASRGRARVEVEYLSHLDGLVAMNYEPPYKEHHFWGRDVASILRQNSTPNACRSTEVIEIAMYSKARVELRDKANKDLLKTVWLNEEAKPIGNSVASAELCRE
ncbi:hypothetical protein AAH678_05025 [Sodalis endosymbiont of Spalangia cameroni]|uniref:hypothetical protein n=1 Tax=Sodalis praecaptivus TaxID=1239307 RepID=UPI0031F72362